MNRCEDSRAGRDSKGTTEETESEDTIPQKKEKERERKKDREQ